MPSRAVFERLAHMGNHSVSLGGATVTRVVELQLELPRALFPDTPAAAWHDNADLLASEFWRPDTDTWRIAVQTWVIEIDGLTVVVDTGLGNDRDRPQMPAAHHLSTGYLDALRSAGFDPADVDVVINTHIHTDHVGWNTSLVGEQWMPTFPNARYLVPEPDYQYFHPDNADRLPPARTDEERARLDGVQIVFNDSIIPVEAAGQLQTWSEDHQISESLRLRPAPGHTPGSSVLWLDAGSPSVFVGDLTHSPLQLIRPDDPCAFDLDYRAARVACKQVLTDASRRRAIVRPAHYPGHGGASIATHADGFMVEDWLELSAI
jgi:glyoxylase-like metal-dependent hydrolase (beta-lactamase superfamily II)